MERLTKSFSGRTVIFANTAAGEAATDVGTAMAQPMANLALRDQFFPNIGQSR